MTPPSEIKFAVIGCGGRLTELISILASYSDITLCGAWDPDPVRIQALHSAWTHVRLSDTPARYESWQELVADKAVDWVFVGSPNCFHTEQVIGAFQAGKNVFAEKPLATSIEDCVQIREAQQKAGMLFATGFTLRYSPLYRKAKELVSSGILGTIISIDATENLFPWHGAYIMTNWRRFREMAGGNILEKCVHDLDILNWLTDSLPIRIAAFGGNAMFTPEKAELFDRAPIFSEWPAVTEAGLNPFTTEKTIEDHLVSILEYANGIKAQFQATMSNPLAERRIYISGSEGTLKLDLVRSDLQYRTIYDDHVQLFEDLGGGNLHGGGDAVMIKELVASMTQGVIPFCGGNEGLRSTVVGVMLDQAWREARIIDLVPIWAALGIEPMGPTSTEVAKKPA